jgi:AcrR family transcriptional regulator
MMQEATTRSHLLIGLGGAMRKGEHTRQEIIRKAAPIFNQRGYDGAALSDLMKATGLEKDLNVVKNLKRIEKAWFLVS